MMRCAYLIWQRSMLWISYHAPSGLRVMGWVSFIGLHPMVVYLAPSGLHFLVKCVIITLKGLYLLTMGVALRIGQLSNKALKGRNRNLLQYLS